jgi:tetratricopeptide (TPR) repeat protein
MSAAVPITLDAALGRLGAGDFAAAARMARALVAGAPFDAEAWAVLGLACAQASEHEHALAAFAELTRLQPGDPAHWANRARSQRALGQHADAIATYARAIELAPHDAALALDLGLAQAELGEWERARECFQRAHALDRQSPEARVHLAAAAIECGDDAAARALLRGLDPGVVGSAPELLAPLAAAEAQLGRIDVAEQLLVAARTLRPADIELTLQLAALFERGNRVDEAERLLLATPVDASGRAAVAARIASRRGNHAEALHWLERALESAPGDGARVRLWFDLAKAQDRLGHHAEAMATLERAHAARTKRRARCGEPELIRVLRDRVDAAAVASWPELPEAERPAPVFVVGFPRSGTTLLETMLDAHPTLRAMDERPFVQLAIGELFAAGCDYPRRLDAVDAVLADRARAVYWHAVDATIELAPHTTLVDKNPLNMARLPAIARLWPGARVILALRHPCDVVLSCFMQHFRNPGIADCTSSLVRGAETYAALFEAFEAHVAVLPLSVHRLRYEDLVSDPERAARALCALLEIPWHDTMRDTAARARARGFISTPSYEQVVAPIHRGAVGRWRAYREHFGPALALLAPWCERYRYDAGTAAA